MKKQSIKSTPKKSTPKKPPKAALKRAEARLDSVSAKAIKDAAAYILRSFDRTEGVPAMYVMTLVGQTLTRIARETLAEDHGITLPEGEGAR